jgi:hypothetical protein
LVDHDLRLRRFDARQFFDLPDQVFKDFRVLDPEIKKEAAAGKSETYRASEGQSPVRLY